MKLERIFSALTMSAEGLHLQRRRMNAIAQNIANAETTKTENGEPYRRKFIQVKAGAQQIFRTVLQALDIPMAETDPSHLPAKMMEGHIPQSDVSLEMDEVPDNAPFRLIYDPQHPDADGNGYVRMPNVNIVSEMADMIAASRSFEANVVVINTDKAMAKDSLEI